MKTTDIQIGADYAVGGPSYTRRATVVGITKQHDGPVVRVQYQNSDWTDTVRPQSVRRPWAEEQAERDAKRALQELASAQRDEYREQLDGAIDTIERVLGIQLGHVHIHTSPVEGRSTVTLTITQLQQLAHAIADTGEEAP